MDVPAKLAEIRKMMPFNEDQNLRLLWATHVTIGVDEPTALGQLKSDQEFVRAWTIQLLCEGKKISAEVLKAFERLAREDKSPVVRLYLASALQRLPADERWGIVESLYGHSEDSGDPNLPLMVWYGAEPLAERNLGRALAMAEVAKLPNILNFTVRRTAALNSAEAFAAITQTLGRAIDDRGAIAVDRIRLADEDLIRRLRVGREDRRIAGHGRGQRRKLHARPQSSSCPRHAVPSVSW